MKTLEDHFPGIAILDSEPVWVENPIMGGGCFLSPEEVAVYDYLKGCELVGDYKGLRRGLDWFISHNAEAYMTLLD
jgi:hypothetical protein